MSGGAAGRTGGFRVTLAGAAFLFQFMLTLLGVTAWITKFDTRLSVAESKMTDRYTGTQARADKQVHVAEHVALRTDIDRIDAATSQLPPTDWLLRRVRKLEEHVRADQHPSSDREE